MAYPISTSLHLMFDKNFERPVEEQVTRIVKNCFEYLDFNFLDWFWDKRSPFVGDGWESWIERAGETAHKLGAAFNQAHAPCPCFACAHDPALLHEYIRRAIIGCHILNIPWMVYHVIPHPTSFAGKHMGVFEYNHEFFAPVQELAHKYGVGIALENIWPVYEDMPYARTEDLIALVDSFNDPLVGVCWDTGHGNLTQNSHNYKRHNRPDLLPLRDQYAQITKLGKRLKCLHINDNNGMDDDHITPFFGTIDWPNVIRALDDISYEHSFTFEAHNCIHRMLDSGCTGNCIDLTIQLLHAVGQQLVGMSRFK